MNDRFEIIKSLPLNHSVPETGFADLNSVYLGVNFVIGEDYREVASGLDVYIHPTTAEDIISYLEGGKNLKMLQFMFDFFLPFESDITTHIVSGEMFELSEESFQSRLGINTMI
jgi:predicted component of type VI protein secretion system